jgi:hypothetical protein
MTYVANLFISPYSIKEFEVKSIILDYDALCGEMAKKIKDDFITFLSEQLEPFAINDEFGLFMAQTILQKTADEIIKDNDHGTQSYIVTFGKEHNNESIYVPNNLLNFSALEKLNLINGMFNETDNARKILEKIYLYQRNFSSNTYDRTKIFSIDYDILQDFPNAVIFRIDNTDFEHIYNYFEKAIQQTSGGAVGKKKYDRFIIVVLLLFVWMLLYVARRLNDAYSYKTHSNDTAQHISFRPPSYELPCHIRP